MILISQEDIERAHDRIRPYVHRTPLLSSKAISSLMEIDIVFKCENFQKAGAFKSRGACNAVFSLDSDQLDKGVATHSSGNHAQALARAAGLRNIPAHIVMPSTAPDIKVAAVKEYGGNVNFCEPTLIARETTLNEVIEKTGATEIHPYNDIRIITGQATCAKEAFEDLETAPDIIIAPVGGGGLLSGTCLSTYYNSPDTVIYAAEPSGADDAYRSLHAGELIPSVDPKTIADGLLTSLGDITFPIISEFVEDILLADEEYIIKAMKLIWERMKIIIEPSSAVPLASLMQMKALEKERFESFKGKKVLIIISGGNVDLNKLPF